MIQYIKQKPLLFILLFAFLIRLTYFIAILILNPEGFYIYDSYGYWQIAFNLKEYGAFSQSYDLPLEPDYYRTPIYPLFILLAESLRIETLTIILLQLILGVLTCYYTFKLSHLITKNNFIACTSALIVGIDIPSIVMNNLVMTETLFTFLLSVCIYFFVKHLKENKTPHLLLSAFICGIAILCRPIGFFIPLLLCLLLILKFRKEIKKSFLKVFAFFAIVLFTISPWLIRNKITFQHYFLSVIREHDMQNYQAAAIYAELNSVSFPKAQSDLRWKTFKTFKGDANKQPYEYAKFIEKDAMDIAFDNPSLLLKNHLIQTVHFFLKPCRAYIDIQLGNWGIGYNTIPKDYPIFKYLFEHNSKLTITLVFFQLVVLLIIYLSSIAGFIFFKKQKSLFYFFVLALIIFCFSNLTLPYVTESRFRIPIIPYLAIISASGIFLIKEVVKKKFSKQ